MSSSPKEDARLSPEPQLAPKTSPPSPPASHSDWTEDLVAHSRDLLCVHDLEGRLLWVNPGSARILGFSVDEVLRTHMREFLDPQFRDKFDDYLHKIESAGEARGTIAVQTRSGQRRFWEYHCTLRTDGVDKPVVRGMAHDVTERIEAEESLQDANRVLRETRDRQASLLRDLQLFRTLVDHSSDAIEVVDPETRRLLDVNDKCCSELGYTRQELLAMTVFDIDPDLTFEMAVKSDEDLQGGSGILERLHRRKDGTTFPVEVHYRRVQLDRDYLVGIVRNISERKMTEEALRESATRMRLACEAAQIGVFERNMQTGGLRWTREMENLYGIPAGKAPASVEEMLQLIHPGDREGVKHLIAESIEGGTAGGEWRVIWPDGSIHWIAGRWRMFKDKQGNPLRALGVDIDITKRKEMEEALRAGEAELWEAQRVAQMGSWRLDMKTQTLTATEQLFRVTGQEPNAGNMPFHELSRFFPVDSWQRIVEANRRAVETGQTEDLEIAFFRGDGTIGWLLTRTQIDRDLAGNIESLHGIAIDVTGRIRAEQALRQSESELREAQHVARMGSWRLDLETDNITGSDELDSIFGLSDSPESIVFADLEKMLTPENRNRLADIRQSMLKTGQPTEFELSFYRPDASTGWLLVRSKADSDETGRIVGLHGIAMDITERKRAEEALRESEERLRLAQQAARIGTFDRNISTGENRWTREMEEMYGLAPGKSPRTAEKFLELVHPEDRTRVVELLARSMESGEAGGEWRTIWPDGSVHWISGRWRVLKDADGKPVRVVGIDYDVTDRKRIEEELRRAKEKLTEEKLYLEQEIDSQFGFEEIVGESRGLKAVMESVGKVASSDATVLLMGETGTGKELVARAIHRVSRRAGNAFIKMNCAAIPTGLLESELFGNEKGAFTGAVNRRIGRLELADRGTIFLDEIGEISLGLQPKLLRVLQDQEFERLGGTQTLKVDFRLIAATNRELAQSVQAKEFRSDLYYRLNVFPIYLPPLRERRDDIPILVEHFVQKIGRRLKKSITSVPRRTMDALMAWSWPGNIRELENFIERSLILSNGSVLNAPLSELRPPIANGQREQTLKDAERQYILNALRDSHGRISGPRGAASRLGLKRTTLQSKLKQLGIDRCVPPTAN